MNDKNWHALPPLHELWGSTDNCRYKMLAFYSRLKLILIMSTLVYLIIFS